MYDYIRLEITSLSFRDKLLRSPCLNNKMSGFNIDTAEIKGKIRARYQGLIFEIFPSGRITIEGSLHKYHNLGEHNHNDFRYSDLVNVSNDLITKFGEEIFRMTVTGLEFGININTLFNPSTFTDRCVSHNNKERSPITKNDVKGFDKGISFNSTDQRIKIYNKSKQYGQPINILRIEVKYLRSRAFKFAKIETFEDLLDKGSINALYNDLLLQIEGTIIKEDINTSKLTRPKERIYLECINSCSWKHWSARKRFIRKSDYLGLIPNFTTNYKETVFELMRQKITNLID